MGGFLSLLRVLEAMAWFRMYLLIGSWVDAPPSFNARSRFVACTRFSPRLLMCSHFGSVFAPPPPITPRFTGCHVQHSPELYKTPSIPCGNKRDRLFMAFVLGCPPSKVPMVPFHTGCRPHVERRTAALSSWRVLRLKRQRRLCPAFARPIFPERAGRTSRVRGWKIGLSSLEIDGALVRVMQKDMKKLVAYSSVSHR